MELITKSQNKIVLNMVNEQVYDNTRFESYVSILRNKYQLNNKVLLIQSPQFLFETLNLEIAKGRGCYAFPPAGLQCIAKALKGKNLDIEFLDMNYEVLKRLIREPSFRIETWLDILDNFINKCNPSIIGVTCLTANGDVLRPNHPLTAMLRHLRKRDDHIIMIGGPTPTSEHHDYLKQDLCHFVVTKEGENKINFLIDSIYGNPNETPTTGIFFNFNDDVIETFGTSDAYSMRGNLIETYKNIPIEDYKNIGSLNPYSRMAGSDRIFATFQLNRGCKANCKFCDVSKFMGRGTRHYEVDDLLEEIKYLVKERNVRHFEVLDDDFIGDSHAVVDFLKSLVEIKEEYGITWAANNGLIAASITEEIMDLCQKSGCVGFKIGIESGNAEMLIKIRKPATLGLLRKRQPLLTKYPNMFVAGCYILGLFEEEPFFQMMDTFRFMNEINLDWSSITAFQVTSKETALIENFKSKGGAAQ